MPTTYLDPTADNGRGFTYTQNASGTYDVTDAFGRPLNQGVALPAGLNPGAATAQPLTNAYKDESGVTHGSLSQSSPPVVNNMNTVLPSGARLYMGADGLQHDQFGNTYQNGVVTPVAENVKDPNAPATPTTTPATTTSATTTPATTSPTTTSPATSPVSTYTGPSIVDYLNSLGKPADFASRQQLAASMGIDGYTGTAAQNTQMLNSLRNNQMKTPGSGTPLGGSTGATTYSSTPATPDQPAKSAIQKVIDDTAQASAALGLGDIKSEYQKFVSDQETLTAQKNAEKDAINNNPWMTQSVKDRTNAQIDNKYSVQENTLTHKISLLDSLYKQGQMEVDNIVSKAETIDAEQAKEAAALAKQQYDAIVALQKEARTQANADRTYALEVAKFNKGTVADSVDASIQKFNSLLVPGTTIDGTKNSPPILDANGFMTPEALREAFKDAPSLKMSSSQFLQNYSQYIATGASGKPLPAYNLTPAQEKLFLGVVPTTP